MSSTVIAKTVAIPTDSSDTIQERSSRERIDAYRSSHKRMICNVHAFFEQEKRDGPIMLESVTKRTTMAMQVSEHTVFRVHRQVNVEGDVHSPAKKGKRSGSGPAQQETDNFQEVVIRRRIHRFYTDRALPTIDKMIFCSTTRHRLLIQQTNTSQNSRENVLHIYNTQQENSVVRTTQNYCCSSSLSQTNKEVQR